LPQPQEAPVGLGQLQWQRLPAPSRVGSGRHTDSTPPQSFRGSAHSMPGKKQWHDAVIIQPSGQLPPSGTPKLPSLLHAGQVGRLLTEKPPDELPPPPPPPEPLLLPPPPGKVDPDDDEQAAASAVSTRSAYPRRSPAGPTRGPGTTERRRCTFRFRCRRAA
jgi:hypothetical protein